MLNRTMWTTFATTCHTLAGRHKVQAKVAHRNSDLIILHQSGQTITIPVDVLQAITKGIPCANSK